jgi:hypothetical protein
MHRPGSPLSQAGGRKRSQGRLGVRLVAKLTSRTRTQSAILENISKSGAKLAIADPPEADSDVILRWHDNELFGRIGWTSATHCAVVFGSLVPPEVLQATLSLDEVAHVPDGLNLDSAAARAWFDGTGRHGFD